MATGIYGLDDEAARARWRALWETSPQRSAFSSLAYGQAVAAAFDVRCEMHLVEEEGTDVAGAIVWWRRRGPYRAGVFPPFTQYSPLLLRAEPPAADVHARRAPVERLLQALEARYHVLSFCLSVGDARPLSWLGWSPRPLYTYRLTLEGGDPQALWSGARRRTLRRHRDAYRVEEDEGAAEAAVSLCARSYARHGRRLPADAPRLTRLVRALQAHGTARVFTATPAGGRLPTAALAVLHDGRTAHYWIAGSDPGPAMTVLLGEVLPRLQASGCTTFDFVGANTPSIAEFKRHFGPELALYFCVAKSSRPELRLLQSLARFRTA